MRRKREVGAGKKETNIANIRLLLRPREFEYGASNHLGSVYVAVALSHEKSVPQAGDATDERGHIPSQSGWLPHSADPGFRTLADHLLTVSLCEPAGPQTIQASKLLAFANVPGPGPVRFLFPFRNSLKPGHQAPQSSASPRAWGLAGAGGEASRALQTLPQWLAASGGKK